MSTWAALLSRELALLVIVLCLGSGLASFLHVPAVVRWALTPALGLAAGSCLLMTAGWVVPLGRATWFVLLPAMACSTAVAVLHDRRAGAAWGLPRREAAALLGVAALVAVLVTLPLAAEETVGPIAYEVADSAYYTLQTEALQHRAAPADTWGPSWDLVNRSGAFEDAHGFGQIGFVALASASGHLLGLDGSDVQAPFMLALVVILALGVFGAVRASIGSGLVAPAAAGVFVAGPLTLQLVLDGSQAALSGLALVAPTAVVVAAVVDRARPGHVVALGVLLAGLHTQYPLFVPALALAGLGLVVLRRRALPYGRLAAALVLSVVLSPVAFVRNVDFWSTVAGTPLLEKSGAGEAPVYDLPVHLLPSWLLQTQSFYDLDGGSWVVWALAPAVVLAILVLGALRIRGVGTAALLLVALGAAIVALRADVGESCSYCVQRSLLLTLPPVAVLFGLGLAAVGAVRGRGWAAALAVAVLAAVAAGPGADLQQRGREAAVVPSDLRALAESLGGREGPVFLEGFGQSRDGAFAFPLSYALFREHTPQRLAVSIETNDFARLAYFGEPAPAGEEHTAGYGWVATRLAGIETPRATVARHGAYALQRRTATFDATVTSGVAAEPADDDPRGRAWVQGPLTVWIAGPGRRPASAVLTLRGRFGARTGARVIGRDGDRTEVCVASADDSELQRLTVVLDLPPSARDRPPRRHRPRAPVARGLELEALRAVEGGCEGVRRSGGR